MTARPILEISAYVLPCINLSSPLEHKTKLNHILLVYKNKYDMLLYDKPSCKIYFHKDISAVHLDWGKYVTTDQFIEACEYSLTALIEYGIKKMIADNSKVGVVSVANQEWLTSNWFPRALEKGFQYSAVILADDAFVKYAIKKIENNINDKLFVVQYFNDVSKAKEWLASVE